MQARFSILLRLITLIALCFSLPFLLKAQVSFLQTQFYSLNDGLSNRLITDIHQTKQGLLWLATPNGLNRFDGYQFTVFNNNWDNPNPISEASPSYIGEDNKGNLVLTYASNIGLFDLFNPTTFEVTKVELLPEYGIKGIVRHIAVLSDGAIYVTTTRTQEDKVIVYRYQSDEQIPKFEVVFSTTMERYSSGVKMELVLLKDGNFLLSDSELGLRLLRPDGSLIHHFTEHNFDVFEGTLYNTYHRLIYEDQKGLVWLSFEHLPGLYCWNRSQQEGFQFQLVKELPTSGVFPNLWEDQKGNILIEQQHPATQASLHFFCLTPNGQFQDFDFLLQAGNIILTVYAKDFFKTLFVAIDTGFKIVQNNQYKVKTFLAEPLNVDQRGKVIRGITDNGSDKVYFAREFAHWYSIDLDYDIIDTINLYDPETNEQINFRCALDLEFGPGGYLWGIICDDTNTPQLVQYDTANCTSEFYDHSEQFTAMRIARDQTIWLTTRGTNEKGALVSFDPSSGYFTTFRDKEGKNPFVEAMPRFILESRKGLLWVGTENGLFLVDPDKKTAKRYHYQDYEPGKGLPSNVIYEIYEDSQSRLWLGTNNGLSVFNVATNTFLNYNTRHGLASNTVCGILPADNGNYWISTYDGLSYFDTEQQLFNNFYHSDGFSHDEFNRFSYHYGPDGRYYFGGVNGLNVFKPDDLLVKEQVPPVIITKISKYNSSKDSNVILEKGLAAIERLHISPSDKFFQVHFSIPDFANPQKNQYQAKLEGYEKSWSYLGNTNYVRYSQLPPDDYVLHIRGADANGNWSNNIVSIPITVHPHFTATWWFLLVSILVLGVGGYGFFQYTLEQRLKVERIRTKLSSDLHDEVSGLLSGIAMQTDVLQMQLSDEKIRQRIQTIGVVSRKAMSKMNDVIWSIDSRKDKIGDLLHRMQEHADDVLLPLNINYKFDLQKIDRSQKMPVNIRQNLYFIFKEAINNIAKHSSATEVNIRFGNRGNDFELVVEDNGQPGSNLTTDGKNLHKRKGQGLSNMKMRAERINADLQILKEPGYSIQVRMRKFA